MILKYENTYEEDATSLLVSLQEHIKSIDIEGYNILTEEYRDSYFEETMKEVNEHDGKIFLYKQDEKIVGLIVGLVNNEIEQTYDFSAPKRGRITELIVLKDVRSNKIGTKLLSTMENYLYSIGCKDILIEAFAYNDKAVEFYKSHGYHIRMFDMTKSNNLSKSEE